MAGPTRRAIAHTIVIGAGIGGLTAAALLLHAGNQVTVLEAHVYPGGSAGTFYHKSFRFDAGATLAGGFAPGGPHARLSELLGLVWPVRPVDPAWVVHLPGGRTVSQWADRERWRQERQLAFPQAEPFWRRQEMLAAIAWEVASQPFPWPPQSARDWLTLAKGLRLPTLRALPYLFHTIDDIAPTGDLMFQAFLDSQLLISAQTTAGHANALYGSAALDLPRRGVNHVRGGIGTLARTLVEWIRANGGQVLYRQKVERIEVKDGRATAVHTNKGQRVAADNVVANVTPWALANLLGEATPPQLKQEVKQRDATWGAFTLYLGLDATRLTHDDAAGHHLIIVDPAQPPGEGNTVFISLSDPEDPERAPAGMRAATLSTHTTITPWWQLRRSDQGAYLVQRQRYFERAKAIALRDRVLSNRVFDACRHSS